MGALLLAAGAPGKRVALTNARVLIHQPMGGARGQAVDIDIQAHEILKMRQRMNEILAEHTGRSVDQIARDTERDYYLSATEARDYGLVDQVASRRPGKLNGGPEPVEVKGRDVLQAGKAEVAEVEKSDRARAYR